MKASRAPWGGQSCPQPAFLPAGPVKAAAAIPLGRVTLLQIFHLPQNQPITPPRAHVPLAPGDILVSRTGSAPIGRRSLSRSNPGSRARECSAVGVFTAERIGGPLCLSRVTWDGLERSIKLRVKKGGQSRIDLAERGGFEPPVDFKGLRRFSKPLLSTTQPPLRRSGGFCGLQTES